MGKNTSVSSSAKKSARKQTGEKNLKLKKTSSRSILSNALLLKVVSLGVIVILLGVVHGLYVTAQKQNQHQFLTGNDYCNGNYTSTTIKANKLGSILLMNYKLLITMGTATISITDPSGNVVFRKTDGDHIFRQHAIEIDSKDKLGIWTVALACKRADIDYELSLILN